MSLAISDVYFSGLEQLYKLKETSYGSVIKRPTDSTTSGQTNGQTCNSGGQTDTMSGQMSITSRQTNGQTSATSGQTSTTSG